MGFSRELQQYEAVWYKRTAISTKNNNTILIIVSKSTKVKLKLSLVNQIRVVVGHIRKQLLYIRCVAYITVSERIFVLSPLGRYYVTIVIVTSQVLPFMYRQYEQLPLTCAPQMLHLRRSSVMYFNQSILHGSNVDLHGRRVF